MAGDRPPRQTRGHRAKEDAGSGEHAASYSLEDNTRFQKHGRMDVPPGDTEIAAVSAKESYRYLARTKPTAADSVLEIGCSTGAATRNLVATGAQVVAVDRSARFVEELQQEFLGNGQVTIACLDGRNIPGLAELAPEPTAIFIDIGGDAHLDLVALQVRLCLRAFRPRAVVVRSFELATLASLIGRVEPPELSGLGPSEHPLGRDELTNLLDLSHSTSTQTRCFAARRLGMAEDGRARERLSEMKGDAHPKVRRAVENALERVDQEDARG